MDFMSLLKSIEELLYELVSWLLFYPLTFWRCVRHPVRMMLYAETELSDDLKERFADALSPPIFLMLTLLIAHLIDVQFGVASHVALPGFLADDRNMLLVRAVIFSLFPLMLAVRRVRERGIALTRETLRPAFYSQCYAAAPFVFCVDVATTIGSQGDPAALATALAIFLAGLCWYVGAIADWFVHHGRLSRGRGLTRSLLAVTLGLVVTLAAIVLIALTIVLPSNL